MSSLSPKDRVSLCSFTFSDGRRCRTPRIGKHPRFCFYHAQKEARARTAQKLGKDLAYFFSGEYLSACDLSTSLARLIPAVVRGDVKSKTAHTVAYLVQTLMQAIHISQHEYINAFGTDGWRKSVRNSVNDNYDYRFPPAPEPEQSALSALRTNLRSESLQPQPQPAAVAHPFRGEALRSASPPQPAATPNPSAKATPPQPAEIPASCHSERGGKRPTSGARPESDREEPAFSSHSPLATRHSPLTSAPASSARSVAPAAPSNNPPRTGPSTPRPAPNGDARALHFDHSCRLLIDGKPF
jgi:hypothetical protein